MDRHQADAAEQDTRRAACHDRRVLNGIFWVLRLGASWCDLPEKYGSYPRSHAQCWRRAQVGRDALGHAPAAQVVARSQCRVVSCSSITTSLKSGSSPSLQRHGIPAPHMQPISSCQARSGWFSHTHPMPRQMWQFLFILPLVTSAYVSQLLANRRCRIANLIDEPL
jgi:transposase